MVADGMAPGYLQSSWQHRPVPAYQEYSNMNLQKN